MFESIINFFKRIRKRETKEICSKDKAKDRLHLVLMQDRANVSADFLEMMKQEIIEVIKKYIEIDEDAIDVRLTNEVKEDGTTGVPSLYANIPILNIRSEMKREIVERKIQKEKSQEKELQQKDKKEEQEKKVQKEKTQEKPEVKETEQKDKSENQEKTQQKVKQDKKTKQQEQKGQKIKEANKNVQPKQKNKTSQKSTNNQKKSNKK